MRSKTMSISKKLVSLYEKYQSHPEFLGIEINNPNQACAVDDTLLHLAARNGSTEEIETLIDCGAVIDALGDLSNTPLHYAAMFGQKDAVNMLLNRGASLKIKNEFSQTALEVAELAGHYEISTILKNHSKLHRT